MSATYAAAVSSDKDRVRFLVGDTDMTCWSITDDGGVRVEWVDDDQVELETGKPAP